MRTNAVAKSTSFTHEGTPTHQTKPEQELRRAVMSCMLWESEFYESGESIADRIKNLISQVEPLKVAQMAIEARTAMKLRHVPLLIAREMARLPKHKGYVSYVLTNVIQRADELSEFLAIYWKEKRQPFSAQVKKGLAQAFTKFDEFQLAKYNRDNAVKLRDVLFLCHAKPKDKGQEETWKKLIDGTLATPDTWEVELSKSTDKKESWERLLREKKLGALALLRNLRSMREANTNQELVQDAILEIKTERVLPFRFIAAARHAPDLEPMLESAMFKCLADMPKLEGKTTILVDVSGSMNNKLSGKSDLTCLDAACGLAMLLREVCDKISVATFSTNLVVVPPRRGFALRDVIITSQPHSSTELRGAIDRFATDFDRMIVITDEQSSDGLPQARWTKNYMINVASYKNGVAYAPWVQLNGWSEQIVNYIMEYERSAQSEK